MNAALRQQWTRMSARERVMVGFAMAAVALVALVMLGLRPAWTKLQKGPASLARLDADLQSVQRAAAEAQALRQVGPVPAEQAQAALKAATAALGPQAQLSTQGDGVLVQLNDVGAEALLQWLGEVRRAARMRPVQAQLQRKGDRYTGTIVLTGSASS